MSNRPGYQLQHDPFGRLIFIGNDGATQEIVVPVRAFPITSPDQGIALVDRHGHELAWINNLCDLPDGLRMLVETELANHEFMPVISRIVNASSFSTPSTWLVKTNRGETGLVLKSEEDIRRLTSSALLITDSQGICYLIGDRNALDRHSRRILDRFL